MALYFIDNLNSRDAAKTEFNLNELNCLFETVQNKSRNMKPYYEYLQKDQDMVKPFFDIDHLYDSLPDDIHSVIQNYCDKISALFNISNPSNIHVFGGVRKSNSQWKLSLHITISSHIIHRKTLVENKKILKIKGFDPSVYKCTKQKFRCIGVIKDGDTVGDSKLFPYSFDTHSFADSFTLDDFKNSCIQLLDENASEIETIQNDDINPSETDDLSENLSVLTTATTTNFLKFNDVEKLELIELIDISFIDDYTHWTHIVWAMKNEGYTEQDARLISQKSHKFEENAFLSLWNRPHESTHPLTLGTLRDYAKQSNLTKYDDLVRDVQKRVDMSKKLNKVTATHSNIAELLHHLFPEKYAFSNNSWFAFNGHRWIEDKDNTCIETDIAYIGDLFHQESNAHLIEQNVDDFSTLSQSTVKAHSISKKLRQIAYTIENSHFKLGVIREARRYFKKINFSSNFDKNPYLLGFNNGVFDLKKCAFRKQTIDDYLTLSVGYDYTDDDDPDTRNFVLNFLRQIFPNDNVRQYVLKMFSRQLVGDACNNLVHIHSGYNGSAANGKSTFFEVLAMVLGDDYVTKFDIHDVMLSKKSATGSNPEPVKKTWIGKRILYASEPEKNQQLQSSLIKDLASQEKVKFRTLNNDNYVVFKPMFKVHIMCNDKPNADTNDQGVCRRLVNVEYISQFVNDNSVDESNHRFKIINGIQSIFENDAYKLSFFKILIEHFDDKWNFEMPHEIKIATQSYLTENNALLQYVNMYLVYTNNRSDGIALKDIKRSILCCGEDFVSEINIGRSFKSEIQKILKVPLIDQTTLNGKHLKNVFRCWKFVNENHLQQ